MYLSQCASMTPSLTLSRKLLERGFPTRFSPPSLWGNRVNTQPGKSAIRILFSSTSKSTPLLKLVLLFMGSSDSSGFRSLNSYRTSRLSCRLDPAAEMID